MSSKPMYFPPAPFDLADAVICSDLVDIAYAMYYQWVSQNKPHHPSDFHWQQPKEVSSRFGDPIWGNSEVLLFSGREPFALVATQDNIAYAIIRGTESLEDWYKDVESHQVGYDLPNVDGAGLVHEGFYEIYKSLRVELLDQLNALNGIRTLFITGHSLGAAIAMVATPDLIANAQPDQIENIYQYNLAGPRAGDPVFAAFLNRGSANIYRIVNSCDIVPDVPPSVYEGFMHTIVYQHAGFPVTYTAQYRGLAGNHSYHNSYNYALKNPEQPQGPVS